MMCVTNCIIILVGLKKVILNLTYCCGSKKKVSARNRNDDAAGLVDEFYKN